MAVIAVFIDAGYLDKVMRYDHDGARIDMEKLAHTMRGPNELLRTYYYDCLPYQSNPPTQEEQLRYSKKHSFTTALSYLSRFEVRLGKLIPGGRDDDGKPMFTQKQVDCMVGVDVTSLASKGRIGAIAIFTGDSDLIPAIQAVKDEGVSVTLWHGSNAKGSLTRPSGELYRLVDDREELTPDIVKQILRS